ncbi:MAG: tRNA lysidine(34) synthetase TilS [Proteobacteria bacterium]|nr:tRNA lysidine(34) synthetase TilS [Pseudomonadota bacterium]
MTDLEIKIREQFESHRIADQAVVIALSGGVDSVVLLDVISRLSESLKLQVSAAHVNHHLHVESPNWANFCSKLCGAHQIALEVFDVQIVPNSSLGVEGAAREARYMALLSHAAPTIVLAHHQDDQIETFFLQALRGSGVDGLSGMVAIRDDFDSRKQIFRPMLGIKRQEIMAYATERGLRWIEDSSNSDYSFSRNYLRNETLPQLRSRFPALDKSIVNVVQNLTEVGGLIAELATQDIDALTSSCGGLEIDRLSLLSQPRAINVLRELFRRLGAVAPGRSWMIEALRQCTDAKRGANVSVDTRDVSIKRYRNHCYVLNKDTRISETWSKVWQGECVVELPCGLGYLEFKESIGEGVSKDFLESGDLTIALGPGNKRFSLGRDRPRRVLRKIWQLDGIPPWVRRTTPVAFSADEALFVGNIGVSGHCAARENQPSIIIEWCLDG